MIDLNKNQQVLAYLTEKHQEAGITVLMKLCYLIDIISFKKTKSQILDFQYIRYWYGPFDDKIYTEVKSLVENGFISESSEYTPTGKEYSYYRRVAEKPIELDKVSADELKIIDEVLELLKGHGARALTDICYKTKPMKAFRATQGGVEHLFDRLDLSKVNL